MKQILALAIFTLICVHSTISCSLIITPLSDFDETEYIFIGEVIGYTQAVKSPKLTNEAFGLIVKLKESVYLPKNTNNNFEVFPIQLWTDCSEGGVTLYRLKKDFPINSEIRVIVKESELLPKLTDGNIRLEDRPGELGSISINTEEDKKFTSTKEKPFDYQSFKYIIDDYRGIISLLPNFETRKDLLKLKNSKTQIERNQLLNRLLQIPPRFNPDLDFHSIFKRYTSDEKEFEQLNDARMKMEYSEEEYKQIKVVEYVRKELIKLGYKEKLVDEAIGKAMQEGIEITNQKVFERTLQILKKEQEKK